MDILMTGTTDCGVCGCEIAEHDAQAEIYDPTDPDGGTDVVHADCMPTGWQIA